MISRINGKLVEKKENMVIVDVNGICYEILIPEIILNSIERNLNISEKISLVTFHYSQVMPSRSIPILIGFTNEIEKEFFVHIISVSGIGPKVAVRALNKPISSIADAIDRADVNMLSSLPGIGKRKAREIIAKLQGKVGKYGLIQDKNVKFEEKVLNEDVKYEAMEVLLQLKYKKSEAKQMIDKALEQDSTLSTTEDILNHIYKRRSEY